MCKYLIEHREFSNNIRLFTAIILSYTIAINMEWMHGCSHAVNDSQQNKNPLP